MAIITDFEIQKRLSALENSNTGNSNKSLDIIKGKDVELALPLPYKMYKNFCVLYNNEIHILGNHSNIGDPTKHYKYNGSSWISVSTLPYKFFDASVLVYNNEIHILGSYDSSNRTKHYKYNGSSWDNLLLLDRYYLNKDTIILIDNKSNMTIGSSNIESISDNSIKLLEDTYIDLLSSTEQLTFYS